MHSTDLHNMKKIKTIWKSRGTIKGLDARSLQNIFSVQQKKDIHTALEQLGVHNVSFHLGRTLSILGYSLEEDSEYSTQVFFLITLTLLFFGAGH